jgi:hypothetical protein
MQLQKDCFGVGPECRAQASVFRFCNNVAKIQLFSELAMGFGEKNRKIENFSVLCPTLLGLQRR